mmetsp:Transcript_89792/g.258845  ORF Transcript_89792/g.258845 Transcript_89792/m.258845 type:complete len:352 (-) Transcript_89792:363-1418(-)
MRRLQRLVHLRELLPSGTVVVPVAALELTAAPWVANLDHVEAGARDVQLDLQDGVCVAIDDPIRVFGVVAGPCAAAHDEVLILPCGQALEKIIIGQDLVQITSATNFRPRHGPQPSEPGVRVVRVLLPLVGVRIELAIAPPPALGLADRVLLPATGQEAERVAGGTAVDIVPTAAVSGDGLLQVGDPQLAVDARRATEEAVAVRGEAEALVDLDVHLAPGLEVPKGDHILVRPLIGPGLEVRGPAEEPRDGPVVLRQGGDRREEPAIPDAALGDVARVDLADDRDAGHIRNAAASTRAHGPAQGVALVLEVVRVLVGLDLHLLLQCLVLGFDEGEGVPRAILNPEAAARPP